MGKEKRPVEIIDAEFTVVRGPNRQTVPIAREPGREPAVNWKRLAWFLLFFAAAVAARYYAIT